MGVDDDAGADRGGARREKGAMPPQMRKSGSIFV